MPVLGLNHVNIRTTDIEATVRFYTRVLGFRYAGAGKVGGFESHWLLNGQDQPIIHLRELAPASESTGPVDHVALDCDELAAVIAELEQAQIKFAVVDTLINGVTQVFVKDPNGVPLELYFHTT